MQNLSLYKRTSLFSPVPFPLPFSPLPSMPPLCHEPSLPSYPPFFCFNHCTNSFLLMHIFKLSLDIFVYHCTLKKPDDVQALLRNGNIETGGHDDEAPGATGVRVYAMHRRIQESEAAAMRAYLLPDVSGTAGGRPYVRSVHILTAIINASASAQSTIRNSWPIPT